MGKGKRNKSERKENGKDEILHIRENHEILDVNKFWDIHQIMREDFYLLVNLKYSLENILIIENGNLPKGYKLIYDMDDIIEKRLQFIEEINKLIDEYDKLDNIDEFINRDETYNNSVTDEIAITKESSSYRNVVNIHREKSNLEQFYGIMIECIILSEKMENLCKEILYYILTLNSRNNEILSVKEENLMSEFTYRKRSEHFKFGLDTNIEQDKIINYELTCEDKYISDKISRKYNLQISSSGILIKKVDHRYINYILKERIIDEYTETGNIFSKYIDIKKTNQIKLLNRILLYIAVITFAFQLLNLPSDYSNFYNKLKNYMTISEINLLVILIFVGMIVILVISELTIFKDNKKYKEK